MESDLYNQQGKRIGKIELPKEVFDTKINPDLLHQVVLYYQALSRQPLANTKDRSEVRGGGRKPWRQKGTGRARHGSIRSPLWKGGGVTFGPISEKKYQKKMPREMRKKALKMVLSQKLKDGEIIFVDKIDLPGPKTKLAKKILQGLSEAKRDLQNKTAAFILARTSPAFFQAIANLPNISTIPPNSLNPHFLLRNKFLIIEKEAIPKIKNQ